jgi:hypothetical protein
MYVHDQGIKQIKRQIPGSSWLKSGGIKYYPILSFSKTAFFENFIKNFTGMKLVSDSSRHSLTFSVRKTSWDAWNPLKPSLNGLFTVYHLQKQNLRNLENVSEFKPSRVENILLKFSIIQEGDEKLWGTKKYTITPDEFETEVNIQNKMSVASFEDTLSNITPFVMGGSVYTNFYALGLLNKYSGYYNRELSLAKSISTSEEAQRLQSEQKKIDEMIRYLRSNFDAKLGIIGMEYIGNSKSLSDVLKISPVELKRPYQNYARFLLIYTMLQGYTHLDPHTGNFLFVEGDTSDFTLTTPPLYNGKLYIIDWGRVMPLDKQFYVNIKALSKCVFEILFKHNVNKNGSYYAPYSPYFTDEEFKYFCGAFFQLCLQYNRTKLIEYYGVKDLPDVFIWMLNDYNETDTEQIMLIFQNVYYGYEKLEKKSTEFKEHFKNKRLANTPSSSDPLYYDEMRNPVSFEKPLSSFSEHIDPEICKEFRLKFKATYYKKTREQILIDEAKENNEENNDESERSTENTKNEDFEYDKKQLPNILDTLTMTGFVFPFEVLELLKSDNPALDIQLQRYNSFIDSSLQGARKEEFKSMKKLLNSSIIQVNKRKNGKSYTVHSIQEIANAILYIQNLFKSLHSKEDFTIKIGNKFLQHILGVLLLTIRLLSALEIVKVEGENIQQIQLLKQKCKFNIYTLFVILEYLEKQYNGKYPFDHSEKILKNFLQKEVQDTYFSYLDHNTLWVLTTNSKLNYWSVDKELLDRKFPYNQLAQRIGKGNIVTMLYKFLLKPLLTMNTNNKPATILSSEIYPIVKKIKESVDYINNWGQEFEEMPLDREKPFATIQVVKQKFLKSTEDLYEALRELNRLIDLTYEYPLENISNGDFLNNLKANKSNFNYAQIYVTSLFFLSSSLIEFKEDKTYNHSWSSSSSSSSWIKSNKHLKGLIAFHEVFINMSLENKKQYVSDMKRNAFFILIMIGKIAEMNNINDLKYIASDDFFNNNNASSIVSSTTRSTSPNLENRTSDKPNVNNSNINGLVNMFAKMGIKNGGRQTRSKSKQKRGRLNTRRRK